MHDIEGFSFRKASLIYRVLLCKIIINGSNNIMNKRKFLIIMLAGLVFGTHQVCAQSDYVEPPLEKIQRPYKFNDNLFWGYSIGGSYSMSSFVAEQPFLSMLRVNGDLYAGKAFSKAFSARLSLGYHGQVASIGDDALSKIYEYSGDEKILDRGPNYSIHMINMSADAMLCLNRMFGNQNQDAKVKLYAIAGAGLNYIFTYSKTSSYWEDYINIDRGMKLAPELHVGLQTSFRSNDHQYFNVQCTWHQSTKDYTGLQYQGFMRHYIELKFGVTRRMLNRYASYLFENCKGNEKYYFDAIESRLLKADEKQYGSSELQQRPLECDTILSFPHSYPYLTPYQCAKLEKMIANLKQNSRLQAVIDIYPYVTTNDEMTFVQSVDRCKDEIISTVTKLWGDDDAPVSYIEHNKENSPIYPDGIWFHNAFIHYENK